MKVTPNVRSERIWLADQNALHRLGWRQEIGGLVAAATMCDLCSVAQLLVIMRNSNLTGTLVIEATLFAELSKRLSPLQFGRHNLALIVYGASAVHFSAVRLKRWKVRAVIAKDAALGQLRESLFRVLQGGCVRSRVRPAFDEALLDPGLLRLAQGLDGLTRRERAVLEQMVEGLLNKQIGYHLGIHESTVKHHLSSIYRKVQVPNRTRLAAMMRQMQALGPLLQEQAGVTIAA